MGLAHIFFIILHYKYITLCLFSTQGELTLHLVFTTLTWYQGHEFEPILVKSFVYWAYYATCYWIAIEPPINI